MELAKAGSMVFLYQENHALDAWFNEAYGVEQKIAITNQCKKAVQREEGKSLPCRGGQSVKKVPFPKMRVIPRSEATWESVPKSICFT